MKDRLVQTVRAHMPDPLHGPIIVSVSGGVDSMVLLDVLLAMHTPLVVAHVNHQKRTASDAEYEAIEHHCKNLGIPFEGTHYNDQNGNFQANARAFRLSFLKDTARKHGTTHIMTAHHFDDRVETFLMRMIEGRSLNGLNPMEPRTHADGFTLIKPFLNTPKSTIEDYAHKHGVHYYEDTSNKDTAYTRNYIRHEIIPRFKRLNASFDDTVLDLMDEIAEADVFLEKAVTSHPSFQKDTVLVSEFTGFSSLFQRRFLKRKIQTCLPSYHPSRKELDEIIRELDRPANFKRPLKEGCALHKEYRVFFVKRHDGTPFEPIEITGPGLYSTPDGSTLEITDEKKSRNLTKVYELWYNDDVYPLYLRHREDGDKIRFSYGHKKIKDLFIDWKIPPHKRNEIVLLTDKNHNVLLIPGLDIKAKQDRGRHCLHLYFHENGDRG